MRVGIAGAGPAGLFFAYLLKRRYPDYAIRIIEQNPADATFGFGVVFSGQALGFIEAGDKETHRIILASMQTWPVLKIVLDDEPVPIDGNDFAAIGRLELLQILQRLCLGVGVEIEFDTTISSLDPFAGDDLVVGADGINSKVRELLADRFEPRIDLRPNKFAWYGTEELYDSLTLTFRHDGKGAFVGHHYRYSPTMSTFIVECDAASWTRTGLDAMDDDRRQAYCENLFAKDLGGHRLIANNSTWRNFPDVTNKNWIAGNTVLIGDALRSAHFSIGSGTRLAMEDAIDLYRAFEEHGDNVDTALAAFEAKRRPVVDKLLAAARKSYVWYEAFADQMDQDPYALAYDYMTRSGRMDDARLRANSPDFMARYAARTTAKAGH